MRAFYRAVNADDLDALVSLLHPDCIAERAWTHETEATSGREAARAAWARELTEYAGARPGGLRVDVRQVAGAETGWGWVRAEWESAVRPRAGEDATSHVGYTDFWVEDGLIRRMRRIVRPLDSPGAPIDASHTPHEVGTRAGRRPIVGVGAVIVHEGRVVLVKRRHEPLAGQWSLPGGALELGETLEAGVAREAFEETGLVVDVGPVVEIFDRILLAPDGGVRFHFVLVDYLCGVREGRLRAGGDAEDVALAAPSDLDAYGLTEKARDVIAKALHNGGPGPPDEGSQTRMTNTSPPLTHDAAWALVCEHVQSDSLRKHLLAVEAAVRGYARMWNEDEDAWGFVALVHDFDYEKYPDRENHPFRGVEMLRDKGYPEWVTRAVLSHADYSGVTRESRLEKALFACDEMAGFVTAAALVRPTKSVLDLEAASVIKRMKDKAFARAVPREDLRKGAEELGLPLDEHITNVIRFLRERADALGLRGSL